MHTFVNSIKFATKVGTITVELEEQNKNGGDFSGGGEDFKKKGS